MTETLSPSSGPYDAVVKIISPIGQGSGVLISPDEILTASHVVYSVGSSIPISFAISAIGGQTDIGTVIGYNPVNDAGGMIDFANTQNDYALIKLAHPLDGVATMGIGVGYSLGGPATTTGYPVIPFGSQNTTATGTAIPVSGFTDLSIPYLGSGSSGGPAWISNSDGTAAIVSIVSSADSQGEQYGALITSAALSTIETWMANSGEASNLTNLGHLMVTTDNNGAYVANLYEGLLNRLPDPAGEIFYHQQVNGGTSLATVAGYIMASPEYTNSHAGQTEAQFVGSLYQNMLGRQSQASEISFYVSAINGGTSETTIAGYFAQSAEAVSHVKSWLFVA